MGNTSLTRTYYIPCVPDPACSAYTAIANGDVCAAVATGSEHLLRMLSHLPPGSVSAQLLLCYDPKADNGDIQSRLKLFIQLWAADQAMADSLDCFVKGGPLSRFYDFCSQTKPVRSVRDFAVFCDIVRRQELVTPLYTADFNAHIPASYYTINSFTAHDDNDQALDKVLDTITEPVMISIRVTPCDITEERLAHTAYLACLAAVNRSYDGDDGDEVSVGIGQESYGHAPVRLEPLHYRDPLADDIQRQQRRFHETLYKPQLCFSIRVMAQTEPVARLIGSVLAESAFEEGNYQMFVSRRGQTAYEQTKSSDFESKGRPFSVTSYYCSSFSKEYQKLSRLGQIATVEELAGIFRLPVACGVPRCLHKNTDPPYQNPEDLIILGYDEHGIARGVPSDLLKKHMSIFGLPGVGKTTAIFSILLQLWQKHIPFLVIESAKKEYRVLKTLKDSPNSYFNSLAQDLRIFTPGGEDVSPFRFNPFEILDGISVAEHIENLLACFKAVLPVSCGSLPALLGEAIELVYEEFPDSGRPPVMTDLVAAVEAVLAAKGYSDQTRADMQTVIEVRLGTLAQRLVGRIFQCRGGISIESLMKIPSVMELDRLPDEAACLLMLFKFNRIRDLLKTSDLSSNGLRYVIVIEEAHNLLGKSLMQASEEIADPKSSVAQYVSRMLVELRALGVGIILSDQHPTAIDPGASKSVGSKLAFRQVHSEDREDLGQSMLLTAQQVQDIARFKPGDTFFFTEGYFEPLRITTVDLHSQLNLILPTDKELAALIATESWFTETAMHRIGTELDQLKESIDAFDKKRETLTGQLSGLWSEYQNLIDTQGSSDDAARLRQQAQKLGRTLRSLLSRFSRGPYKRFLYLKRGLTKCGDEYLIRYGDSVFNSVESAIKPAVTAAITSIDNLIQKCTILAKEQNHG